MFLTDDADCRGGRRPRGDVSTVLRPLGELSAEDLAHWRKLAAGALEPNPFYEPEYTLPLARALGELGAVELAVARDGEEWLACVPVRRVARWHRIPLPALATWRGRGVLQALLATPLIATDRAEEGVAALLRGLTAAGGIRFVALDGLVEGEPVYRAVLGAIDADRLWSLRFSEEERAFLRRTEAGDYLERAMQGKHLSNLRRLSRRLGETLGGEPELVELAGHEQAVDELVALEAASRLAEEGEVIAADPAITAFFAEMCAGFAAQQRLQLWALRVAGRTVAMKCNLLAGPGVFTLKIAYDEALERFSPGIQLDAMGFDRFHADAGSEWIDSCASPGNATVERLMPERRALVGLTLARRGPGLAVTAPAVTLAKRMRDRAMNR